MTIAEQQTVPPRSRLRRMFSALHYRDYRLLWIGAATSTSGTWMQIVAQAWLVLQLTGSAFLLGVDAFLSTLPMILFSLIGGAVADRVDRRKLLLGSQIGQMTCAFTLAALVYFDVVEVWHIFILSFLNGTVQSFGAPAYQALLAVLVDREDVPNAIAMNSIQFNLARVIGPVLAGLTLTAFGAAACFAINGVSFIAVIITLTMIRATLSPVGANSKSSVMGDIRDGLKYINESAALVQLSIFGFVAAFFGIPLTTLLPVVAKEVFHLDAQGYSWMLTAHGVGAVAGALVVAAAGSIEQKGKLALLFEILFAVLLGLFAFSHSLWITLPLIFLAGGTLIGLVSMVSSLIQLATTEIMRGRVMAMFMLSFRGGMPLGNLASGWFAEKFSVSTALAVNAACLLAAGLFYALRDSEIKKL